ncbi:MAG: hypothetical protein JO206_14400, partial [Solirubrobacterales bacterium]|nr:hypothetical protein [Solirubrobacterales bacterium]
MTDEIDELAQRIADRGREALVARLRPAFEQAAATYADAVELDGDQLEQMVQQAADRADGLLWRRTLAGIATDELGIRLGEALTHPAVERAQDLLGAPSYEISLAELRDSQPAAEPVAEGANDEQEPEPEQEPQAEEAPQAEEEDSEQAEAEAAAEADEDSETEREATPAGLELEAVPEEPEADESTPPAPAGEEQGAEEAGDGNAPDGAGDRSDGHEQLDEQQGDEL